MYSHYNSAIQQNIIIKEKKSNKTIGEHKRDPKKKKKKITLSDMEVN